MDSLRFVDNSASGTDETHVPLQSAVQQSAATSNLRQRASAVGEGYAGGTPQQSRARALRIGEKHRGVTGSMHMNDPVPILCHGDECESMYLACNHTSIDFATETARAFFLFFIYVFTSNLSYHFAHIVLTVFINPGTSDVNRGLYAMGQAAILFAHVVAMGKFTGAYFNVWYSVGAALLYLIQGAMGINKDKEFAQSWGWELFKALPLAVGQLAGIVVAILAIQAPLGPVPAGYTFGGPVLGIDDFTAGAPQPLQLRTLFLGIATIAAFEFAAYVHAHSVGGLFGFGFAGALLIAGTKFITVLLSGPYIGGNINTLFWLATGFFRNQYPAWESFIFAPLIGVVAIVLLSTLYSYTVDALCDTVCKVMPAPKDKE